ncbi:MAG: GNAT family N-acetyltransferase [Rhodobacteraceae bacterium]|nr:GNAT family N-acetyltransferase [Paracoccaceae bacterium]
MTRFGLTRGKYSVRIAETEDDVRAAQKLRHEVFIASRGAPVSEKTAAGIDSDDFDADCDHVLIEERRTGKLVCCFRLLPLKNGEEIGRSYSAQYYELSNLKTFPGPIVEMGRFCIHPDHRDSEVLRIAWGAMTRYVDTRGFELLCGCSSFEGNDAQAYADAFALLKDKHLAPTRWLPRPKAPNIFKFAKLLRFKRPDNRQAMRLMPPLLRGYLSLGGWVSDHAVIDRDLNTLHVFTGLEVKRVPLRKVQLLRQA